MAIVHVQGELSNYTSFVLCQNNFVDCFRYEASYMKGEDVWELRIKNVEERDSGLFECQVRMYSFVYLPF